MTVCIQCAAVMPDKPIYWIQHSKPQMVEGCWKNLFVPDIDWPLCDVNCSADYEKAKRSPSYDGRA